MTQLQTFDDTQKLIQKYGTRDPFELIDALPNTKLWSAKLLGADGLRGFATIVNRVRYIAVNSLICCLCPQRRLNQRSGLSQKCPVIIWFPKAKTSTAQEQSSNTARYGITRGASYFANGGEYK